LRPYPGFPGITVDEARIADVCARPGIARLRVSGSVARGTRHLGQRRRRALRTTAPAAASAGRSSSSPTNSRPSLSTAL